MHRTRAPLVVLIAAACHNAPATAPPPHDPLRTLAELTVTLELPADAVVDIGFGRCSLPRTGDAELLRDFETAWATASIAIAGQPTLELTETVGKGCPTPLPHDVLASAGIAHGDVVHCLAAPGADLALATRLCRTMKPTP
jgi:hypothetical protein